MTTWTRRAVLPPYQAKRPVTGLQFALQDFIRVMKSLGKAAGELADVFTAIAQACGVKRYRSQRPFRHYVER